MLTEMQINLMVHAARNRSLTREFSAEDICELIEHIDNRCASEGMISLANLAAPVYINSVPVTAKDLSIQGMKHQTEIHRDALGGKTTFDNKGAY